LSGDRSADMRLIAAQARAEQARLHAQRLREELDAFGRGSLHEHGGSCDAGEEVQEWVCNTCKQPVGKDHQALVRRQLQGACEQAIREQRDAEGHVGAARDLVQRSNERLQCALEARQQLEALVQVRTWSHTMAMLLFPSYVLPLL
jgi:hypothetical protein